MKYLSAALLVSLLGSSLASALDFGSIMQAVTPVAQSAAPAVDTSMTKNPLIQNLTSSLGVTPTQAIGGTAVILNDAKTNMKPSDFSALNSKMPQVGSLLSAVPSNFTATGTPQTQFALLGMAPEMINKFTPLILQYLQNGTTPGMAQLVQTALAQ